MSQTLQTLYHYCNNEAFQRIIEDKCIYLSCGFGTNDYLEGKWIIRQIAEVVKRTKNEENKVFFQTLSELITKIFEPSQIDFYVACFSSGRDILSQWRAYSLDGKGFAIGFNPKFFGLKEILSTANQKPEKNIALHKVIYDDQSQLKLIREIFERALGNCHLQDSKSIEAEALNCLINFQKLAYVFKNSKFSEELEWRIIHASQLMDEVKETETCISDINFRTTSDSLVPFFELDFSMNKNTQPINEIIIGPKNKTPKNVLQKFLYKNGFKNILINYSEASYR